MLGKEWTREFFDKYVIWLESTLFCILQKYNIEELEKRKSVNDNKEDDKKDNEEILNDLDKNDEQCNDEEIVNSFKNILNLLGLTSEDNFIEYLLQSNNKSRYPEMAFLLEAEYIDNCDMNNFYFRLLEKDGKIIISQKDEIKGLKLLISEFLYQCGYDSALKIQQSLLDKNIDKAQDKSSAIIEDKKEFTNVEAAAKNGEKKNINVSYRKLRGLTTWYAVRNKVSSKITKNKNGDFVYKEGDRLMKILNNDVIEYISKDYI